MDQHSEYTKRIEAFLAGDLPESEERALLEHVRTCPECRAAFSDAKRFDDLMTRALAAAGRPFARPRTVKLAASLAKLERTHTQFFRERRSRMVRLRNVAFLSTVAAMVMLAACLVWYARILDNRDSALVDMMHSDIRGMMQAAVEFKKDLGEVPRDNRQLVDVLRRRPPRSDVPYFIFDKRYVKGGMYHDIYGRPYKVVADATRVKRIYSFGPNGIDEDGAGDDITIAE